MEWRGEVEAEKLGEDNEVDLDWILNLRKSNVIRKNYPTLFLYLSITKISNAGCR
jgi:hypothetical protein